MQRRLIMAKTVVGLFDTRSMAEQAVQALVDSGVSRDDVSVVANNNADDTQTTGDASHGDTAATGAATGALGGGVLGGTLGLLVGLGVLALPGIGPILAAGPIAAALGAAGTTALVGAGIGAVSGGLLGALVGAGIPEEDANYYAEGVRRGGTLIMARVDDAMTGTAYNIMQQQGAVDIEDRGSEWRQSGWDRFDPDSGEWDRSSKVGTGGGAVAGAATGAAMGSVGGPVGTAIGGIAGAAVGAGTGAAGDAIGREARENAGSGSTYDSTSSNQSHDRQVSGLSEPIMSDANDRRPAGGGSGSRRGVRIYGDEGRYDWDDTTRTAVALGAANSSGVAGSSGTMGNTTPAGAAAAAGMYADTSDRPHGNADRSDSPAEDWKESSKVGTAGGTVAGAATGAAMGSVGGPVGTVVGGIAGAVTGAVTGAAGDAAGEATEDAIDDDDGGSVDREATNDVAGRKGQVKPRE